MAPPSLFGGKYQTERIEARVHNRRTFAHILTYWKKGVEHAGINKRATRDERIQFELNGMARDAHTMVTNPPDMAREILPFSVWVGF